MRHRNIFVVLLAGLTMSFGLGLIGCSKNNPASTTDTLYVNQQKVCIGWLYHDGFNVSLKSDPVADTALSSVSVSWPGQTVLALDKYVPGGVDFSWLSYGDYLNVGDSLVSLNLVSNIGYCSGAIKMPDSTKIISPIGETTLPIGEVTCYWASSKNADFYEVLCFIDSHDSTGYTYFNSKVINLFTNDTLMSIPSSDFSMPSTWYSVYLIVYPCNGPKPQKDAAWNLTGSIPGFIVGEGDPGWVWFFVGSPKKNDLLLESLHKPSVNDRMMAYMNAVNN